MDISAIDKTANKAMADAHLAERAGDTGRAAALRRRAMLLRKKIEQPELFPID